MGCGVTKPITTFDSDYETPTSNAKIYDLFVDFLRKTGIPALQKYLVQQREPSNPVHGPDQLRLLFSKLYALYVKRCGEASESVDDSATVEELMQRIRIAAFPATFDDILSLIIPHRSSANSIEFIVHKSVTVPEDVDNLLEDHAIFSSPSDALPTDCITPPYLPLVDDQLPEITMEELITKQTISMFVAVQKFRTKSDPAETVAAGSLLEVIQYSPDDQLILVDNASFAAGQWLTYSCLKYLRPFQLQIPFTTSETFPWGVKIAIDEDEEMIVTCVEVDCQWALSGVRAGWRILWVDEQEVNEDTWHLVRDTLEQGHACTITFEPSVEQMSEEQVENLNSESLPGVLSSQEEILI